MAVDDDRRCEALHGNPERPLSSFNGDKIKLHIVWGPLIFYG
jgi:hypothetical protein